MDANGNAVVTGHSQEAGGTDHAYTAKYASANGSLLWEKRSVGEYYSADGAGAVAVGNDGNVAIIGISGNWPIYDYYTAKLAAADGALLWEAHYTRLANSKDVPSAVAVDGSGNVVVTGGSGTIKYQSDGTALWTNSVDGIALVVDGLGNVVVTGSSRTIKCLPDGTGLWTNSVGGSAVALDIDGNVVVTGTSVSANSDSDYYTAKFAVVDGALLWERRYNGPLNGNDGASSVAVDRTGNVVVTGSSQGSGEIGDIVTYEEDFYTAKYGAGDGALQWENRHKGTANYNDVANAVAVDAQGNVVMTGAVGTYNSTSFLCFNYYTAKYAAADGALLWERRYDGRWGTDQPRALVVDHNGDVVVTGFSGARFFGGGFIGYYTAKYAAVDGALLWEQCYDGPASNWDGAQAVVLDSAGNVVVTGGSGTIKYLADGTGVWTNNTPATVLALDGSDNVIMTGYSYNTNMNTPWNYAAKYAAADGALLWENRFAGHGNTEDRSRAVAVDPSGDIVVTGYSITNFNADYYTAKYAAADGALVWERRYTGPNDWDDLANAVAVDSSGNVIVTGHSGHPSGCCFGSEAFYTAKYAAKDGALLWEHRYEGGGQAVAVAVDSYGNALVTGSSYDRSPFPGGHSDYFTVKYAAADGALIWEKRYNGPANHDDFVNTSHGLALGPNGMVVVTGTSNGDLTTVVYREVPEVLIGLVPHGVWLRVTGASGRSYQIERAPAVTGPWSTIASTTTPVSGIIEYVDTDPRAGAAFYRAVVQP